jgi:hypothetical protein
MNDRKLKKLFDLARAETPPEAPGNFSFRVLGAIRREGRPAPLSWWDQLGALFPRLALATALVVSSCIAADYYYSSRHAATFAEDATLYSTDQALLAANGDGS